MHLILPNDITSIDGKTVRPKTDALGRNTGKTIEIGQNKIAEEQISYVKFGDHATFLPSTVRYAENGSIKESVQYKYDSMGNITEVLENGLMTRRYGYDALGRLVREDNTAFNQTVTYTYDDNGNRIARRKYALSDLPTEELHSQPSTQTLCLYDGDRLLSYGSDTFIYDDVGNPTTYRGKNATWAYGRQLVGLDGHTFTYDARGRRIAKSKGEDTLTFFYDDSGKLIAQSNGLTFLYDHTGLFAVKDGNVTYYCRKNPQSDILCLLDSNGNIVVKYEYDAWGDCKVCNPDGTENTDASFIGNKNPFRYRSYYFDADAGLYFLQTRYYDPETGRFLSSDDFSYLDPETVGGLNLYAYCNDDPVNYCDPTGHSFIAILIAVVAAGLISGGAQIATNVMEGKTGGDIWRGVAGATLGAAAGTAVGIALMAVPGACVVMGALTSSLVGNGVNALEKAIRGESIDWRQTSIDFIEDFAQAVALNALSLAIFPELPKGKTIIGILDNIQQNLFTTMISTTADMVYYGLSHITKEQVYRKLIKWTIDLLQFYQKCFPVGSPNFPNL